MVKMLRVQFIVCLLIAGLFLEISGLTEGNLIVAKDNGLISVDLETHESDVLLWQDVPFSVDVIQDSDKIYRLYWSNIHDHKIYSGVLHNDELTNITSIITSKNGAIEGIAIEWVAGHLYWVNSELGLIEVSTLDGRYQSAVITHLVKPRALAVDPLEGLLFWSDWNEKDPHIGRSTLSGNDATVIVEIDSAVDGWINAISLVHSSKKIYWIDAKSKSINEATYNGQNRRRIFSSELLELPMGMLTLDNKVLWSDRNTRKIYEITIDDEEISPSIKYETFSRLYGMTVLRSKEVVKQNPCSNNGGCSHLCLINRISPACYCPYGTSFGHDNKTCQRANNAISVLYQGHKKENSILYIQNFMNPSWPLKPSILLRKTSQPIVYEYDEFFDSFVWFDEHENKIFSQNSTGHRDTLLDTPKGTKTMAVELKLGSIYLGIGDPLPQISHCSKETRVCIPLVTHEIGEPHDLIIHNEIRQLFWLNKLKDVMKIESYNLDNAKQRTIASGTDLCCMTVDLQNDNVFWIDKAQHHVIWKSIDGNETSFWPLPESAPIISLSVSDKIIFIATKKNIISLNLTDKSWNTSVVNKKNGNIVMVKSLTYSPDLMPLNILLKSSTSISIDSTEESESIPQESYNTTQIIEVYSLASSEDSTKNLNNFQIFNDSCTRNCSGNGKCVKIETTGDEVCECLSPSYGINCEHIKNCRCPYGKCIIQNDRIRCICDEGFNGFLCKKKLCQDYCFNGNCSMKDGEPSCDCHVGWSGPRCEQQVLNDQMDRDKSFNDLGEKVETWKILEINQLTVFGIKINNVFVEIVIAAQFVMLILMTYCLVSRHCDRGSPRIVEETTYSRPMQEESTVDGVECRCDRHTNKKCNAAGYLKKLKEWLNSMHSREVKSNLPCWNSDGVELLHKEKPSNETTMQSFHCTRSKMEQ